MISGARAFRILIFAVWAVLMTALTYILGAPSLKVLRRRLGRANYWLLTTLISVGLYFLKFTPRGGGAPIELKMVGIAFFSLVILMGVFDEFEEMGFNFKASALLTLLINSMLAGSGFALWVYTAGQSGVSSLRVPSKLF